MLNIGQVVYDLTNKRVIIFAGTSMFQNQKTGKCHVEEGFILKDGTFIHVKDSKDRGFKYTNFTHDGKAILGGFAPAIGIVGCYFGIIDGNKLDDEEKAYVVQAIEQIETLIEEHGLNITDHENHNGPYQKCHIGEPKEYTPKLSIDTPKVENIL